MNRFATIIEAIRFKKVTYYTVKIEDEDLPLFQQFVNIHSNEEYTEEISLIRSWLRKIGNEIGAQDRYFRPEGFRSGDARALPPFPKFPAPESKYINVDCNLRLYCMRINDDIVILFSGAKKTARTAQECDNVRPHFMLANRLSKAIDEAIKEKDIKIDFDDGRLLFEDTLNLEI